MHIIVTTTLYFTPPPPQINACANDMYYANPTRTKQEWALIFGGVMVRAYGGVKVWMGSKGDWMDGRTDGVGAHLQGSHGEGRVKRNNNGPGGEMRGRIQVGRAAATHAPRTSSTDILLFHQPLPVMLLGPSGHPPFMHTFDCRLFHPSCSSFPQAAAPPCIVPPTPCWHLSPSKFACSWPPLSPPIPHPAPSLLSFAFRPSP